MSKSSQKTWGGRFSAPPTELVKQFTESVSFDWRLYPHDIAGSIAHARGLARTGILTKAEAARIGRGLRRLEREIRAGRFRWDRSLEDVHMNIEAALVRQIGPVGAKLHTARSRNDQVATDLRLWLRDQIDQTDLDLRALQLALVKLAEKYAGVMLPGYTHLQRAQPVLFGHHLLAYAEMFERDRQRLADCRRRTNVCPLGAAALAGSTIRLDRQFVARQLGFDGMTRNSMDAVSDRDFVVEFLAAAALIGTHLSRLGEDLILWSTAEFGFIAIGDAFATGSSLMPQKKNPDVAELTRGKTGRLYGDLLAVLTCLKGLPLTYNRDLQEDKQPLFDATDTVRSSLSVMASLLGAVRVNRARCEAAVMDPLLLATDLVDFLVGEGVPFREAHHQVGKLVAMTEKSGPGLPALAIRRFGRRAAKVFDLRRALQVRRAVGAPSPANLRAEIRRWRLSLR